MCFGFSLFALVFDFEFMIYWLGLMAYQLYRLFNAKACLHISYVWFANT